MLQHLRSLRQYFQRGGVEEEVLNTVEFSNVIKRLTTNVMTSEELMLSYYNSLVEEAVSIWFILGIEFFIGVRLLNFFPTWCTIS